MTNSVRWADRVPRGVSALGLVVLLSLVVALAVGGFVRLQQQQVGDRNAERRLELEAVARAQEYYYDRWHRYGTLEELVAQRLLPELPRDPVTGEVYALYRTAAADEWCAWARLEAPAPRYLTHGEGGARERAQLPTSLATCKN